MAPVALLLGALAGGFLTRTQAAAPSAAGWVSPGEGAAQQLLYVGSALAGTIDIFAPTERGYTQVGQIVDWNAPQGLHTDAAGNLYVADAGIPDEGPAQGDIAVYLKGATSPWRFIVPGYNVSDVVPTSGGQYIFASNYAPVGQFGGSASAYGPNGQLPLLTVGIPNAFEACGIAFDVAAGSVFVTYTPWGGGGRIVRIHGRQHPVDVGVSYGAAWGIVQDRNGNLVVGDGTSSIRVFSQRGKTLGSIAVSGDPSYLAFNAERSLLFVSSFGDFDVQMYTYPNGQLVGTVHAPEWNAEVWPLGIALWNAARAP